MTSPETDGRAPLDRFYSVIPAGGIGSRLWPLSRADAPKFLHDLTGSGQTLLRDTWDRLAPISGADRIMVVTGRAHRAAVEQQLESLEDLNVVLESEPRDSSAAIGLAAAILERREPGVIIGSFAADHVISGQHLFHDAVAEAVVAADAGFIATIGITPTEPAVGFGYIRTGDHLGIEGAAHTLAVDSFVEKPDADTARTYVQSGQYLWNAGMFIARADRLLEELGRSKPKLLAGLLELAAAWDTPERGAVVDRIWPGLEKIAIDYSVAEPAAARRASSPSSRPLLLGRRRRLRVHREAARERPALRPGHPRRGRPRPGRLRDRHRRQRRQPHHRADRREGHRRRRHPRRAPGHHHRERPEGEGRRRRPPPLGPHRRPVADRREIRRPGTDGSRYALREGYSIRSLQPRSTPCGSES